MDLIDPMYAISCNRQWGPIFACDIQLCDKCNVNKYSNLNFPWSYNFTAKPYAKNE